MAGIGSTGRKRAARGFPIGSQLAAAIVIVQATLDPTAIRESKREIVLAVFARIAALSGSKDEAAGLLRNAEQDGDSLVTLYYQRLASFERQRDHYATLREFLPHLVRGLPAQSFRRFSVPVTSSNSSPCSSPEGRRSGECSVLVGAKRAGPCTS